jgi:hypothetical protein
MKNAGLAHSGQVNLWDDIAYLFDKHLGTPVNDYGQEQLYAHEQEQPVDIQRNRLTFI